MNFPGGFHLFQKNPIIIIAKLLMIRNLLLREAVIPGLRNPKPLLLNKTFGRVIIGRRNREKIMLLPRRADRIS
jgi:hypothetical protein